MLSPWFRGIPRSAPLRNHSPLLGPRGDRQGAGVLLADDEVTGLQPAHRDPEDAVAWLEGVIEGSPDAIFISDERARFVLVNSAATRLTRFAREELLTMEESDLFGELAPVQVSDRQDRMLSGESVVFGVRVRRRGGSPVEVEARSRRMVIGRTAYVHTVARDLGGRRPWTLALTESEDRYRVLFEEMQEGFALHEMIWDEAGEPADYRFLDVNPAFERLTGLRKSDIIGRRVMEVLPGTEESWIERYGEVVRTGAATQFDAYARELDCHFSVSAFRPARNQFAVIFADITPRVLSERGLRETADRLAMAQDLARIGFIEADLSTGKGTWSPVTFELLGLEAVRNDVSLDEFLAALLPDSRSVFLEGIEAGKAGRIIPPFTFSVSTPSGMVRRLGGYSSVTGPVDGGGYRLVTVLRDVTREEAAEAREREHGLRMRALASRLAAVREEERATLARELHDGVGQALTALRMDLSLLRSDPPANPGDLREAIDRLILISDESVDVVRDISSRLRPPILDIMGLGPALEWQVEEYGKREGPSFEVDVTGCPADLSKEGAVVLFRIAQEALTNVLRHATAESAWVTVRSEQGFVVLEVGDDGVGIADDILAAPSALGLVGMQERASSLGGALSIGNHPAGGTLVRVRLPLIEPPAPTTRMDGPP